MKTLLEQLFFDKELVKAYRTANVNPNQLYVQLMNGKITLKEYIAANKR